MEADQTSIFPVSFGRESRKRTAGASALDSIGEVGADRLDAGIDPAQHRRATVPMAKKAAPKAAEPKAPAPVEKAEKSAARPKAATKADIYAAISEKTTLSKKDVSAVFDAMGDLIGKELGKKGPGLFQIPGLLNLKVVRKPATKAKPGINPFTKEPMTVKAKPARNVIKAVPLKALKDLV
jgi:nucleoid DNA-binding protein